MTKWRLDSQQMSRVCLIHTSQFGTTQFSWNTQCDRYVSKSQSKQVSIVEQSAWCGSHEKCSLKTACLAEHERKIHCILIASPHVIVFALCFCIFANPFLRMNNISSCVEDCSAALELQPSYSKALHRWRKAISQVVIWKSHRWR